MKKKVLMLVGGLLSGIMLHNGVSAASLSSKKLTNVDVAQAMSLLQDKELGVLFDQLQITPEQLLALLQADEKSANSLICSLITDTCLIILAFFAGAFVYHHYDEINDFVECLDMPRFFNKASQCFDQNIQQK